MLKLILVLLLVPALSCWGDDDRHEHESHPHPHPVTNPHPGPRPGPIPGPIFGGPSGPGFPGSFGSPGCAQPWPTIPQAYCPYYERFDGNQKRGDTQNLSWAGGDNRELVGYLTSRSVDIYSVCRINYRTETQCRPVPVPPGSPYPSTECRTISVPYADYSTREQVIDTLSAKVSLEIPAEAILVPGEVENFQVSYNSYYGGVPSVRLPNTFNRYNLRNVQVMGEGDFDLQIDHEARLRVNPSFNYRSIKIRKENGELVVHMTDDVADFLRANDLPDSKLVVTADIKRQKIVRYIIPVATKNLEFPLQSLQRDMAFDLGKFPGSTKDHGITFSIKRVGSRFYSEKSDDSGMFKFDPDDF